MAISPLLAAMDEVKSLVNGHSWADMVDTSKIGDATDAVTASRVYRPAKSLEGLRSCLVEVCLPRKMRERVARGVWAEKFLFCIGITAPLPAREAEAAADEWMKLADAMTDFLTTATYSFGSLEKLEDKPTADVGQIDADPVFTRVLVATFQSNQVIR